ncbi:MAG: hypothetical protein AVDCRST_MAG13-374, partial [uncultured Solirubrobacteraceae bacterium]
GDGRCHAQAVRGGSRDGRRRAGARRSDGRARRRGRAAARHPRLRPPRAGEGPRHGHGVPRAPARLLLPRHLALRRADDRRPADARRLRRDGGLRRARRADDPHPQPREPLAARRDRRPGAAGQALRPRRGGARRQHEARRGRRPAARLVLRGPRRHPHELRRRRDALGHVDHLRGDLQLRLGGEQRDPGHGRAARLLVRGPRRRHGPRHPAAALRRRPLLPRGRGLAGRRALRDRGPRQRGLLPLPPRARAARGRRPGLLRRHAPGARRPRPAELRRQHGQSRRGLPRRVGDDRGAQPAHGHGPGRGAEQGRGDLRPHGGRLDLRPPRVVRLHDGRRGPARPALGAAAAARGPGRPAARLRVDVPGRPGEPGQRRGGARHGRRLPAGGRRRRAVRPRRDPARADLRLRPHAPQRVGVLRGLLQPRRPDVLPQPAGRPARRGRGPDPGDPARGHARADVRDLGALRGQERRRV